MTTQELAELINDILGESETYNDAAEAAITAKLGKEGTEAEREEAYKQIRRDVFTLLAND